MGVALKPASKLGGSCTDNLCRWDGTHQHYEVWFLTVNHRASKAGFWFRYAIENPTAGSNGRAPRASLWAAFFDRAAPEQVLGLVREWPIDEFAGDSIEGFKVSIAGGLLTTNRAKGSVSSENHTIAWDLSFAPNDTTYHHISPIVAALTRPSSYVCSPNIDVLLTGVVSVDGREFELDDEPGCQSHLWGRKRADDWVWVHSNSFEKNPGTVFEGLAARVRRAGRKLPPIQSLFLRHRGEEHRFTRVRIAEQWQRKLGMGYWSFAAMNTRLRIEGVAQCRLRDMIQAEYTDPDGEPLHCINSEVANLKIRLFRRMHGIRFRHVETINARGTAHLEHASRERDADVTAAFSRLSGME